MLKDVPVYGIWLSQMGAFHDSELHKFDLEYVLSHIVRMSQQRGEWVTEFTEEEFLKDFNPEPICATSNNALAAHFHQLINMKYLKYDRESRMISVTQKFANLCKEQAG